MIVQADLKQDIEFCKNFNEDGPRLKCYDRILKTSPVSTVTQNSVDIVSNNGVGEWQETINIDPMTDKEIVVLSLDAESPIHTKFSFQRVVPSLYIRCKDRKTEAYISWGTYLGLGSTKVTTRIDKQRKSIQSWGLSTDNQATFSPSGYSFARSLLKHKKLVASTIPYGESPVTTTFNIDGFGNAVKNLRKSCSW